MVAVTTSLILIKHYQAIVGGLYLADTNMVRSHVTLCGSLYLQYL